IGHTDEAGSENFNYILGMERAQRIANELAITYGIPSGQIDVRSEGKTKPISKDDKGKNRRVGVYLK
ncbi:MAG: OmpA family protein, partial [Flavobacteriales bacterium]|nr:OmpA family protein [Flavobacteriales bacterium]MBT6624157.1 OmpA family protein [Flavobacteriales bacterium]